MAGSDGSEPIKPTRNQIFGDRHTGDDAKMGLSIRPQGLSPQRQVPHRLENLLTPLDHGDAGRRQLGPAVRPVEELQVQGRLQRTQSHARRGLTHGVQQSRLTD